MKKSANFLVFRSNHPTKIPQKIKRSCSYGTIIVFFENRMGGACVCEGGMGGRGRKRGRPFEPVRYEPVHRAELIDAALNRFTTRFFLNCKKIEPKLTKMTVFGRYKPIFPSNS